MADEVAVRSLAKVQAILASPTGLIDGFWFNYEDGPTSEDPSPQELRYYCLAVILERDTSHFSDPETPQEHPAFRAIVRMGHEALPWLLRDLHDWCSAPYEGMPQGCRSLGWRFSAIAAITQDTILLPDLLEGGEAIRQFLIAWGCEKGYMPD